MHVPEDGPEAGHETAARGRAISAIRMALEAGHGRPFDDLFAAYGDLVEEHYRDTADDPERRAALYALTLSTCAKAAALLVARLAEATGTTEDAILDGLRVLLVRDT
jgi:hypothetical protein